MRFLVRHLVARVPAPLLVAFLASLSGCPRDTPPEPTSSNADRSRAAAGGTAAAPNATVAPPVVPGGDKDGSDPFAGNFTMADATKGLAGAGPLVAKIDTSKGLITCKLYDDKAPKTVANFVGLARGTRPFKDPKLPGRGGEWVMRPWYDGTSFHRVIKGFMVQGGDPLGTGTGEPGFVVPDEIWPGAKHDRAGLLCMANRGHNTNGGQFFITDDAAAHLDGNYTIFGECTPVDTVHAIGGVDVAGSKPTTPVNINSVKIERAK
jgi:peptidyl-prolyl cis-trans isomerase A (cyclophilin A)